MLAGQDYRAAVLHGFPPVTEPQYSPETTASIEPGIMRPQAGGGAGGRRTGAPRPGTFTRQEGISRRRGNRPRMERLLDRLRSQVVSQGQGKTAV